MKGCEKLNSYLNKENKGFKAAKVVVLNEALIGLKSLKGLQFLINSRIVIAMRFETKKESFNPIDM